MGSKQKAKPESPLPEFRDEFLWDMPWIRTNRFRNKTWSFSGRILIGFILGLLLGRVIGSLQGILGQWIFTGVDGWLGGSLDATLGRVLYVFSLVLGTILKPLIGNTPMEKSFAAVSDSHSGAFAVLFLAQLHGTVNGLYQGLRPAFGYKLSVIIEAVILPWGKVWSWLFRPFARRIWPRTDAKTLRELIKNASSDTERKKLMSLAHADRLPTYRMPEFWTESESVLAAPSGPAKEKRAEQWWRSPGFRMDTYRWIGSKKEIKAFPLLLRGTADPDTGARRQAVMSMAALQSPVALHSLIDLLADDDEEVRKTAEKGLEEMMNDEFENFMIS